MVIAGIGGSKKEKEEETLYLGASIFLLYLYLRMGSSVPLSYNILCTIFNMLYFISKSYHIKGKGTEDGREVYRRLYLIIICLFVCLFFNSLGFDSSFSRATPKS